VAHERDFALAEEDGAGRLCAGRADAGLGAETLALLVVVCLGEEKTPDDEDDGRACAEPVQGPPLVGRGVDEAAGKGGAKEVAKGVLRRACQLITPTRRRLRSVQVDLHLAATCRS